MRSVIVNLDWVDFGCGCFLQTLTLSTALPSISGVKPAFSAMSRAVRVVDMA